MNERDALGDSLVPDYITHLKEGGFYSWFFSGRIRVDPGLPTKGRSTGKYESFLTEFGAANGDAAWGRPVGVAVGSDGCLLVSDDASTSIWRVSYTGK